MQITYLDEHSFLFEYKNSNVVVNPNPKTKKEGDITLLSFPHPDFASIKEGTKSFVISSPGEYEKSGVFVKGLMGSETEYNNTKGINTIYLIDADNIRIAVFGAEGNKKLSDKIKQSIGSVDIAILPIDGSGLIGAQDAYTIALSLNPSITIPVPMNGNSKALEKFKKAAGGVTEVSKKKTIKKKDLTTEGMEVFIFS